MPPRQALQTFDSRLAAAMGTVRDTQALPELLREGGSDPGVLALPSSQPTQQVRLVTLALASCVHCASRSCCLSQPAAPQRLPCPASHPTQTFASPLRQTSAACRVPACWVHVCGQLQGTMSWPCPAACCEFRTPQALPGQTSNGRRPEMGNLVLGQHLPACSCVMCVTSCCWGRLQLTGMHAGSAGAGRAEWHRRGRNPKTEDLVQRRHTPACICSVFLNLRRTQTIDFVHAGLAGAGRAERQRECQGRRDGRPGAGAAPGGLLPGADALSTAHRGGEP